MKTNVLIDRLNRQGAAALTPAELLATIRHRNPTDAHIDAACADLRRAGCVRDVMAIDPYAAAAAELARRSLGEQLHGQELTNPLDSATFLKAQLGHLPYEVVGVLFLDNRHRVLAFEEMFRGTIDGASVHPREVVRSALKHNAAAVILAHNHPSGVPEPSAADQHTTRELRVALALIGVRVLDHLVIGDGEPVSMASRGLI